MLEILCERRSSLIDEEDVISCSNEKKKADVVGEKLMKLFTYNKRQLKVRLIGWENTKLLIKREISSLFVQLLKYKLEKKA